MARGGFWQFDESVAYDASGSFVGWLVMTRGLDRWRTLHATGDFQAAYGSSLDELDAGWRSFLQDLPVDVDSARRARVDYDPVRYPSMSSKRCPKLGLATPELHEDAAGARRAGNLPLALELYRRLEATDGDERWTWGVIAALLQMERWQEVLETLETLPPTDAVDERVRRLDGRIQPLRALGRLDELRSTLDERLALADDPELAAVRALLDDEGLAAEAVDVLRLRHEDAQVELSLRLEALQRAQPEHAAALATVRNGWGTRASISWKRAVEPADRRAVREMVARVEAHPETCDAVRNLVGYAEVLLVHAECETAALVADVVDRYCQDPITRWRLSQVQDRLAWEGCLTP